MEKRVLAGLQWKHEVLLLAMASIVLSDGVSGRTTKENSLMVDWKLKHLNKPAVKSIQSEDGDIIDCVDIYKQPAFDHPALKDHKIQMKPSYHPTMETQSIKNDSSQKMLSQTWQRSGSCPHGTIPIRRIKRQDLLRATSDLDKFGRKNPQTSSDANKTLDQDQRVVTLNDTTVTLGPQVNKTVYQDHRVVTLNDTTITLGPQVNRSSAILVATGFNFLGAKGDINVWNPSIGSFDEYSSAQIWLKNGPRDGYESVESGWVVNPSFYGDTLTRFFAYWTVDGSKETGCFDLYCSGFVQTSQQIALGAAVNPISSEYGKQYEITIHIYMDPNTSNWWLSYGNGITLGYWPGTLFSLLKHSATLVEWGGEVYSSKVSTTPHTTTHMGSGEHAGGLLGVASYIAHVRIMDYSMHLKFPQFVGTYATEPDCYSADFYIASYATEPLFYFGGPGQNYWCP